MNYAVGAYITGTVRPTLVTNVINGLPVVRFSGAGSNELVDTGFSQTAPYTVFAVLTPRSSAAGAMLDGSTTGTVYYSTLNTGAWVSGSTSLYGQFADGTFRLTELFNGTGAGGMVARHGGIGMTGTGGGTWGGLRLGRSTSAGTYTTFDLARMLIYNRLLTTSEAAQLRQYLSLRYNVPVLNIVGFDAATQPQMAFGAATDGVTGTAANGYLDLASDGSSNSYYLFDVLDTTTKKTIGIMTAVQQLASAGTSRTADIQTLTVSATSGNFTLSYGGIVTGNLAWNISAASLQTALNALTSINGCVTVTGGPASSAPLTITFVNAMAGPQYPIVTNNGTLAGGAGTATIVHTQTGNYATDEMNHCGLLAFCVDTGNFYFLGFCTLASAESLHGLQLIMRTGGAGESLMTSAVVPGLVINTAYRLELSKTGNTVTGRILTADGSTVLASINSDDTTLTTGGSGTHGFDIHHQLSALSLG